MKKSLALLLLLPLFTGTSFSSVSVSNGSKSTKPIILFVGDSITAGVGSTDDFGFRRKFQQLQGASALTMCGNGTSPDYDATYQVYHGGVSGESTAEILARVPEELKDCFSYSIPGNSLFFYGGTNPTSSADDITDAIELADAADPLIDVYIVISQHSSNPAAYDSFITAAETAQLTKSNVFIVNIRDAFNDTDLCAAYTDCAPDGVHPNDFGSDVIGTIFSSSVDDCLAEPYCYTPAEA